jgi:hypothetical protein
METMIDALAEAIEPPQDYFGAMTDLAEEGWARVFGRSRDSDNLEISNYETVLASFAEKYELNEDYRVEGSSHWAVGWTDTILVHALDCGCERPQIRKGPDWESKGNKWFQCHNCNTLLTLAAIKPIFKDAWEFKLDLDNYPLLDEEDYSRREHEDFTEWVEQELGWYCRKAELSDEDEEKVTVEEVVTWLYRNGNVSRVDEVSEEMMIDAVKAVATKQVEKLF